MPQTALSKKERYLLTVRREETDRPPVWIMRQAGRYMPEYRDLRKTYGFRDFCLNPEVSARATMLPLEILDIDILIIFNDILIPLEAMGLSVAFPEGGPRIANPVRSHADLEHFTPAVFSGAPVSKALQTLRTQCGPDVPVLGFCGSPFTLALYAIEGHVSRNQEPLKHLIYTQPELMQEILQRLTETATNYLVAQVEEGGADGVQIFESWGGSLPSHLYEPLAARWQREVIRRFRRACPGIPVHLYVRWTAGHLDSMAAAGADVLGIDWGLSLAEARRQTDIALQGNLDPMVLLDPNAVDHEVPRMVEGFDWRRGWIANLGHGITPEADPAAALRFVQAIHRLGESSS